MHGLRIGIVATALLIVLPIFCSASFAKDQSRALIEAAKQGDLKQVQNLLNKGADVNAKDENGWTALKITHTSCHKEIAELLKAHGAKE
jgi:ankyrin repeat protein